MCPRYARLAAILVLMLLAGPVRAEDSGPLPLDLAGPAVRSGRASSPDWAGMRLWAAGAGYSVGRRSVGYGLGWGAALPLLDRVDLTASYRVNGFSLGQGLGLSLDDVDAQVWAPFLGLDVEF